MEHHCEYCGNPFHCPKDDKSTEFCECMQAIIEKKETEKSHCTLQLVFYCCEEHYDGDLGDDSEDGECQFSNSQMDTEEDKGDHL